MKTELVVRFEFQKSLPANSEAKIKEFVKELQAKVKDIKVSEQLKGNSLNIEIKTSEGYPTDFIVQLDRKVKEFFGRNFKVGTKDYEVSDYSLELELEKTLPKLIIPFADKLEINGKKAKVYYKKLDRNFIEDHRIERTVKLIQDKVKQLNYQGKDEFKEYVWEGKKRKTSYVGDPTDDLEKKGWIKRTGAKGQFIFGREITALVNVFKELMIENIYSKLGFNEMIFPKFEPWSVPKKSGHAKNVYSNAYFIMTPKEASSEYWQEVMDEYAITHEINEEKIKAKVNNAGIMSYAQCPPFWPYLERKTIDNNSLPIKVYDWSGPTYRNESGGVKGLDRLEEFHRTETLWVAEKKEEIKIWKEVAESLRKFFDKILDIEVKMAKVTPWWMAHAGIKTEKGTEEVGTFDFDAFLPYRGREKEWLEIQNVSSNGTKYPEGFNVSIQKGELFSGCAGGSFERWLVAFLSQKGLEPKSWPSEIKKRFLKKIKGIKELKLY